MLCELYDKQSSLNEAAEVIMERQRSVIDRFVHLLSVGLALPVVEKVNKMFRDGQIDVSLVRFVYSIWIFVFLDSILIVIV